MKRKHSMTEECFDSIMAEAQETGDIIKDVEMIENKLESDKDSDYGGSDYDTGEATTLRMLLERIQASDVEFVECCQQVGLLPSGRNCSCGAVMFLYRSETTDGVEWKCGDCSKRNCIREQTWTEDVQVKLKDLVLVMYCWSRNYPENLCCHEIDSSDVSTSTVRSVYDKCQKLCLDYLKNATSNIGSVGETVELEIIETENGTFLGGVERNNKNFFFDRLPHKFDRDDLITSIVDNISSNTTVNCHKTDIIKTIKPRGVEYLRKVWKLDLIETTDSESSEVSVRQNWSESFESSEPIRAESIFRRRMEANRDPFLFLLNVISTIYPSK